MKENMSRRAFVGSSAVLAGGAALGIAGDRGFRQIGPVDLKWPLMFGVECVLPAFVYADERRDRFGIRLFEKDSDVNEMTLPLRAMQKAIHSRCGCSVTVTNKDGSFIHVPGDLYVDDGKFVIVAGTQPASVALFWFDLRDVRRVL